MEKKPLDIYVESNVLKKVLSLGLNTAQQHWNKNVAILTKFSSLAALEVVILTTSSAASD